MGGNERIRAPAHEHSDCKQPEGAGAHSLAESEVPDAEGRTQRPGGLDLAQPLLPFALPVGLQSELLGIASDHPERQCQVEDQRGEGDPEARAAPAGDDDHIGEDRDEEELAQTAAGEREADGETSALLEPVAYDRAEEGDSDSAEPGSVEQPEVEQELPQ